MVLVHHIHTQTPLLLEASLPGPGRLLGDAGSAPVHIHPPASRVQRTLQIKRIQPIATKAIAIAVMQAWTDPISVLWKAIHTLPELQVEVVRRPGPIPRMIFP